jgi:hypothetical protein
MATTSSTLVGNSADSHELVLRPSFATGHDADILDVSNPYLSDDAENIRQCSARTMRSTSRAGLLAG